MYALSALRGQGHDTAPARSAAPSHAPTGLSTPSADVSPPSRLGIRGGCHSGARMAWRWSRAKVKWEMSGVPLPGKPDFAWGRERLAVFVDGCFWHGHDCGKNVAPRTNAEQWREKILNNGRRDRRVSTELRRRGWSVLRVWECHLRTHEDRCIRRIERAFAANPGR